jgi:hypothetical protein
MVGDGHTVSVAAEIVQHIQLARLEQKSRR